MSPRPIDLMFADSVQRKLAGSIALARRLSQPQAAHIAGQTWTTAWSAPLTVDRSWVGN
jgi:hypothetical protein